MADAILVQLIHGSQKKDIQVSNDCSVKDLEEEVAKLFHVPSHKQKLICKGKSLSAKDASLKELGIKSKSKIMVLGKKSCPEEDQLKSTIASHGQHAEDIWVKCQKILADFQSVQQGFLSENQTIETLNKLEKQAKIRAEELLRIMMALDGLELDASFTDARQKRKDLIKTIQKHLDEIDKLEEMINQVKSTSTQKVP